MKKCAGKCGLTKPYVEFSKNRQNLDGYATYCRLCNRAKMTKWRRENPEKSRKIQVNSQSKKRLKRQLVAQQKTTRALTLNRLPTPDGTSGT